MVGPKGDRDRIYWGRRKAPRDGEGERTCWRRDKLIIKAKSFHLKSQVHFR